MPKNNGKYTLTIRLPDHYRKMLFEASNQEGDSFNSLIKNALKKYLEEEHQMNTRRKTNEVG